MMGRVRIVQTQARKEETRRRVRAMLARGMRIQDIHTQLHCSESLVRTIRREMIQSGEDPT